MALEDFKLYAGMSPEEFIRSIGLSTDGYSFLWYRAEDVDGVDGYDFQYWPEALRGDLSGYQLNQPNPSARYAYWENQINGYPAVGARSGVISFMIADSPLFTDNILNINTYMFAVVNSDQTKTNDFTIGSGNYNIGIGMSSSNERLLFGLNNNIASISSKVNQWVILYGNRLTTGTVRNLVGVNNLDLAASATQPSSFSGPWTVRFGTTDGTSGGGVKSFFYWAEVIFVIGNSSTLLTDAQVSAINYYLSSKYNIPLESGEEVNRFYYTDAKNSLRPQLNESLANPLPFDPDGYFCRSAELPAGGLDGYETLTRHSLSDGYMVGLDNSQAISIRAWVRAEGLVDGGKSQLVLFTHMDDPWKGYSTDRFIAYGLKFGTIENDGYAGLGLRLAVRDSDGYHDLSFPDINCSGTFNQDTWYRIRMDVVPVGSAEDRISVYTGTGLTDSETWTPVGSLTVQSSDTVYRSKSIYNEQGYYIAHVNKDNSHLTTKYYIDRFQVRVKDL